MRSELTAKQARETYLTVHSHRSRKSDVKSISLLFLNSESGIDGLKTCKNYLLALNKSEKATSYDLPASRRELPVPDQKLLDVGKA